MLQAAPREKLRSFGIPILLAGVTIGLALRLLQMVDLYAVDLLFYDQIELYEAFLDDPSAWDLFRYQHGPHRQGLPFLGTWLLARLTDWNARADAFHVLAYVVVATGLALALRRRLSGPFAWTDVAIPLLLLTPAQYGIFVHAPNASHCAGPLVLLLLMGHAFLIRDPRRRVAALVVLDFLAVHTGFAIFAGAPVPILLGLAAARDHRAARRGDAAFALGGAILCIVWIGVFLVGYTGRNGLAAVENAPRLAHYPIFVATMFANVLGLKDPGPLPIAVGALVALAAAALVLRQLPRLVARSDRKNELPRKREGEDERADDESSAIATARAEVLFLLAAFSLLYCAATAVGRVQFGLSGAQSSRYVPLVAPAFLALVLFATQLERKTLRHLLGGLAVAALVQAGFPMHPLEEGFMKQLAQKKRSWVASYRETGSVEQASRAARLRIDPFRDPRRSTDETFAWLREQRLSFFADR